MAERLIVANLPPDVTENEIETIMTDAGVEQITISLNREGDPNRVLAVLIIGGADRAALERIASRINGMRFRERTLNAYVPLFT